MKSGADFEQTAQTSAKGNGAPSGIRDFGNNLQQRALAGAIPAENPDYIALGNFEANIIESPKFSGSVRVLLGPFSARGNLEPSHKKLAKVLAIDRLPQLVLFREVVYVNDGQHGNLIYRYPKYQKPHCFDAATALEYYSAISTSRFAPTRQKH